MRCGGLLLSALVLMVGWITASDPRLAVDVDEGLCPLGGGTPFSVRLGRLSWARGTSPVGRVSALARRAVLGAIGVAEDRSVRRDGWACFEAV